MKLVQKHIIQGTITVKTGLHIGGGKSSLDIGGLDAPVIKTAKGIPYIPGSSIKGKLRSLLGMKGGSSEPKTDSEPLRQLFGCSEKGKEEKTRAIFRDAYLDTEQFKTLNFNKDLLATEYTEEKYENVIDRVQGKAKNGGLRQMERVPADTVFLFEIILNQYDEDRENLLETLKKGIDLLNNDYLGGSGTRGYGQVKMEILSQKKLLNE